MLNFQYYTPTKVVFGKDAELKVGPLVKAEGCKKVLVHYGGQSAKKSGLLDRVCEALKDFDIDYVTLGGVVPNPHLSKVYEGIELCKKEGVDFILAVGGGSVIDSCKAIAYGLGNPDVDVWDLFTGKARPKACYPLGSVLTIAAAGSEMSNSCVITNEEGWYKKALDTDLARPKFAIMNPEITYTLPDYQTQCGCADIMMHTMERYFVLEDTMEITDKIAQDVMKNVMKYAKILKKDPKNYEARAEIMWCGSLSHNGLTGCGTCGGDWATHLIEHELGGMFDVAHGAGLAAVWGSWARYVMDEKPERFAQFAVNVMGVEEGEDVKATAIKGIEAVEDFYREIEMPTNLKELGIVVKADVQGSVEAIKQSLLKLSNDEVVVKIIHGGVGAINESDVILASASNAIIIGFNVRPDATAKDIAEREGVDLRLYRVIYNAIEDVEAAMKGMLDPVFEEKVIGHAEVRQIFKASGVGNIAGSYVLDGVFQRGCTVRISREGKQIFEGPLASLKRFKDDVKEVKAGYECGLVFEGFNDIQELDQVEAYIMVEVPR